MRIARTEFGESLIEVLIAMVIIGIAGAALIGGLSSGIFSSSIHRQQTIAGTILESSGESLANSTYNPYVNCATPSTYNPSAGFTNEIPASGWTVSITQVSWWNGTSFIASGSAACPDTNSDNFLHLQLVDVTVLSPHGQVSETRSFAKPGP